MSFRWTTRAVMRSLAVMVSMMTVVVLVFFGPAWIVPFTSLTGKVTVMAVMTEAEWRHARSMMTEHRRRTTMMFAMLERRRAMMASVFAMMLEMTRPKRWRATMCEVRRMMRPACGKLAVTCVRRRAMVTAGEWWRATMCKLMMTRRWAVMATH